VTALGALRSRLGERLRSHSATVDVVGLGYLRRLLLDTHNATGALGELPHVIRI
jgi:hypothetical protein